MKTRMFETLHTCMFVYLKAGVQYSRYYQVDTKRMNVCLH